jgi:FkbM family methyltransferase
MTKEILHKVDGFNWALNIEDNGIGRTLASSKTPGKGFEYSRESFFMNLMDRTIKPGMTCIDLGANIGYATMFMLRNSNASGAIGADKGTVYAIEPDSHNLKYLKGNLRLNGYYDICEQTRCLISDKDGQSDFWIAKHPNLNSVKKTKHSVRKEVIDCFSLNTFCSTRKYPNFIKMDIEGHEVSVFEGGYEYFKNNDGETHFLLEVHPQYYNEDNDFAKILRKYFDIGFKVSYLVSTPVKEPKPFKDAGYSPLICGVSDGWNRCIYDSIHNEDGINFVCNLHDGILGNKIVRSMMLSRRQ